MSNYLLDTYALVECFIGSERGQKVRDILASKENTCYIASEGIAEAVSIVIRRKYDPSGPIEIMRGIQLVQLDADTAEDAGRIHAKMREKIKNIGLMDAILIAIARRRGLKIVTGDQHFKNVPEAVMI